MWSSHALNTNQNTRENKNKKKKKKEKWSKFLTKNNLWCSIMACWYNVILVLTIICGATKINHLYSTRLGHSFEVRTIPWWSRQILTRKIKILWETRTWNSSYNHPQEDQTEFQNGNQIRNKIKVPCSRVLLHNLRRPTICSLASSPYVSFVDHAWLDFKGQRNY